MSAAVFGRRGYQSRLSIRAHLMLTVVFIGVAIGFYEQTEGRYYGLLCGLAIGVIAAVFLVRVARWRDQAIQALGEKRRREGWD